MKKTGKIIEIKVPSPGESVTEVELGEWAFKNGEIAQKDDTICELDSDKATLEVVAEETGELEVLVETGETVSVGDIIGKIQVVSGYVKSPAPSQKEETPPLPSTSAEKVLSKVVQKATVSPAAEKMMREKAISKEEVSGTGKKEMITKQDILQHLTGGFGTEQKRPENDRTTERKKMTTLRKKLMKRLVGVKNETALLTTFNEVDMNAIMRIRAKYKAKFAEEKGVGLGFMSFFTKAVSIALQKFPEVNAQIDDEEIVYHNFTDIGIAVSSPKGLMVPILRNVENMSLANIESGIKDLAIKARNGKISIAEMTGGTFTITNGGVFGSMMSTPIINPPQSAILGMHNIIERPIAINGKVVIRPMMYLALSYDHRIIDGKESVSFLKSIKEMIEDPTKILFDGVDAEKILLGI